MPELAPYVSAAESWAVRSQLYRAVLSRPGSTLLLAHAGDDLVGYGLGYILTDNERGWLDDTWAAALPVGEIESLAVLPVYRGQGIGTSLLARLEAELMAAGAGSLVLGVLPGNDAAVRMYVRQGYLPTWLYLTKLEGRSDRRAMKGSPAPSQQ